MIIEILKNKNDKTVFTLADIANMTGRPTNDNLISSINYYIQKGDLISISKGLYALSNKFDPIEFANKLRRPSYVSFYTIMQQEGMVYQQYNSIFMAANRSETIKKKGLTIIYRQLKNEILLNPLGIINGETYSKASKERALCDKIYLDGEEYFDNLREIDWEMIDKLTKEVYKSDKLDKLIKNLKNAK